MPTFGTIQRAYPKATVLRGFDPNEPRTRQISYPVSATSINNTNGVVYSGQVISLYWNVALNQYEWVLGVYTAGATPHIALQDSVDADVVESGKLTGLSCSGQFEIQIGYYDGQTGQLFGSGTGAAASSGTGVANGNYYPDTPLTFSTIIFGNITTTTLGSSVPLIGFVSRNRGPRNLSGEDSGVIPANNFVVAFNTQYDARNN